MIYDVKESTTHFILEKTNLQNRGRHQVHCEFIINDFCFTPDTTLQGKSCSCVEVNFEAFSFYTQHLSLLAFVDPGLIAFAHSVGHRGGGATTFLDIWTGQVIGAYSITDSEPLCVQFRKNHGKHQVLFGHRNGGLSLIDTRSPNDTIFAKGLNLSLADGTSFGSATTMQSLQKDDNLVVMKGLFGSCRMIDLRCLSTNDTSQSQQATVLEYNLPESTVHQTKSVRCTGLAIDPTESMLVAPFANQQSDVSFAMWNMTTGALLRTVNLNSTNNKSTSSSDTPAFCEILSSVITPGYEMLCSEDSDTPIISSSGSSWGLWFKTGSLASSASVDCGGIHHMKF